MLEILAILLIGFLVFEIIELFWLIFNRRKKSMVGVTGMLGQVGEVKEWNETQGRIFVNGALWMAISETPLSPGDKAIIQSVEGLTLKVKPFNRRTCTS